MFAALTASRAASLAARSAAAFSALVGVCGGRIASAASNAMFTAANASGLTSHRLPLYSASSVTFRWTAALVRSGCAPSAWETSRNFSLAPLLWSLGLVRRNSNSGLTSSSGNSFPSSGRIASASCELKLTDANTCGLISHRCGLVNRYSAHSAIFLCTAFLVKSG